MGIELNILNPEGIDGPNLKELLGEYGNLSPKAHTPILALIIYDGSSPPIAEDYLIEPDSPVETYL